MLNRIVFLSYGDEGRTSWKCLACGCTCDAGYPSHREYKFCPHCGTQWESEQQNARSVRDERYYEAGRYPYEFKPFDCTADMTRRYHMLKVGLRADRQERTDRWRRYAQQVEEYLEYAVLDPDPFDCQDVWQFRPRFNA